MNILVFLLGVQWPLVAGRFVFAVGVLLTIICGASLFLYWRASSLVDDDDDDEILMTRKCKTILIAGVVVGVLMTVVGIVAFVSHDGAILSTL